VIRAALNTNRGPIGIIGINQENLRRLQAGMPLDIDIKAITPPGTKMGRLIIHYAHTYEEVVQDMEEGGLPVTDTLRAEARKLDEEMSQERQAAEEK
jgi:hypothetical protein